MAKPKSNPSSRKRSQDISTTHNKGLSGLVVSTHGQHYVVEDTAGDVHRCTTRSKIEALVCGDRVIWQETSGDEGVIVSLQARTTLLARPDSRGKLKPVAANLDQLLVVISAHPESDTLIDSLVIDRYLVAAELSQLHAAIVLNKVDLLDNTKLESANTLLKVYRDLDYPVLLTSAKQRLGIDTLESTLQDRTSVFVGTSGVGKSSLVKTILPDEDIRIGEVSNTGMGRHTTTHASLFHLPHGGSLIDSPGVRDFNLWHASPTELAQGFVEFQRYAATCRFADCLHGVEPGCAVQDAVESGAISAQRFANYRRLLESNQK